MSQTQKLQEKIDAYLMQLRRSLGELPPEEVNEILREIRGTSSSARRRAAS